MLPKKDKLREQGWLMCELWSPCQGSARGECTVEWGAAGWQGKMTASFYTGGLCSVQVFEVSSVGGNISVCSVEMSQRHVSRLSTHKLKYLPTEDSFYQSLKPVSPSQPLWLYSQPSYLKQRYVGEGRRKGECSVLHIHFSQKPLMQQNHIQYQSSVGKWVLTYTSMAAW